MSCTSDNTTEQRSDDEYSSSSCDDDDEDDDDQSTSSADSSEEIDVEGIDDTCPTGSSNPVKKSGKTRKIHQNDLERKRRDEISQSYRTLKKFLGIKMGSRSQVLLLSMQRIIQKQQLLKERQLELQRLQELARNKGILRTNVMERESSDSESESSPSMKPVC